MINQNRASEVLNQAKQKQLFIDLFTGRINDIVYPRIADLISMGVDVFQIYTVYDEPPHREEPRECWCFPSIHCYYDQDDELYAVWIEHKPMQ